MRLISKISQNELVKGLPNISFDNDSTCEQNVVLTARPLKLLCLDLFGPTRTSSLACKKYDLVIMDDFSRFTWVIFIVYKDEACEVFKVFKKKNSK